MRAAVLTGPGEIEVEETPVPDAGAGEVLIRLEGCGVCASNLGPWAGPEWMEFPTSPGDLGHEGWGVVEAVGRGVASLAPGDRVAALSFRSFAEYDVAAEDAVVKLPKSLEGQAVPGEPLGCAMNIFRRADVQAGQTVAIVGIGFLGALVTRLCTDAGARVIGISRRDFSLDLARRYGAVETVQMDDHQAIIDRVMDLTRGQGCERVIEAVGLQWPLDLAGELVAEGGKLVIAGYHQDGPRQVNMQMWNWKGIDVVNAHERDQRVVLQGMRDAVDAVAEGRLDPTPLFTHEFPLQRLGDALNAARDRPAGFLKALIRY